MSLVRAHAADAWAEGKQLREAVDKIDQATDAEELAQLIEACVSHLRGVHETVTQKTAVEQGSNEKEGQVTGEAGEGEVAEERAEEDEEDEEESVGAGLSVHTGEGEEEHKAEVKETHHTSPHPPASPHKTPHPPTSPYSDKPEKSKASFQHPASPTSPRAGCQLVRFELPMRMGHVTMSEPLQHTVADLKFDLAKKLFAQARVKAPGTGQPSDSVLRRALRQWDILLPPKDDDGEATKLLTTDSMVDIVKAGRALGQTGKIMSLTLEVPKKKKPASPNALDKDHEKAVKSLKTERALGIAGLLGSLAIFS